MSNFTINVTATSKKKPQLAIGYTKLRRSWDSFYSPAAVVIYECYSFLFVCLQQHVLSDAAVRRPFDPEELVNTVYNLNEFQDVYFFAESFVQATSKLRSSATIYCTMQTCLACQYLAC